MKRYWHASENIKDYVRTKCHGKVLDVGAGDRPFDKATDFVDIRERPGYEKVDISHERLPYPDDTFDFVHCSHTLEDIVDPLFACEEIRRVGKAGYIETPSAIQEFAREVEADDVKYRGHHHHRYFIWHEGNTLYLLPKYPIVEYLALSNEEVIIDALDNPFNWINCFVWDGDFEVKLLQHDIDFNIRENYGDVIVRGIKAALKNAEDFLNTVFNYENRLLVDNPKAN